MSLMDYLNTSFGSIGSSTGSTTTKSSVTSSSLDQILGTGSSSADDVLNALVNGKSTVAASGVAISASAAIAAAAKADKDKDADTLSAEIRASLNAQYAKDKGSEPDFSEASPRALSTVILNDSGSFSATEVYAAKQEMRKRDREAFLQVTSGGFSLASIKSFQEQMAAAKTSMSDEEKTVRASGF